MLDPQPLRLVSMVTAHTAVLGLTLLVALAAPSSAAAVVCGETVTASVVLDADLNCPVGFGIVIGADDVTINLAGHTIAGDVASGSVGIANATGFDRITIKDGTIRRFELQIRMAGGEGHVIRNVQLRGGANGIDFEPSTSFGKVLKILVTGNDGYGIRIRGNDHQVSQAVLVGPNSSGIFVQGSRHTVAKSTIVDPTGPGIFLNDGEGNVFTGNTISAGDSDGIRVDAFGATGNVVSKNLCEANEGDGIALVNVQEGVVTGNTVVGNGANGIRVGNASVGNEVSKNKVFANYGSGIYVPADSSFTAIVGNVARRNRNRGIDTDSAIATIGKNVAEANRRGGIEAPPGVTDAGGNKARYNNLFECSPGVIECK